MLKIINPVWWHSSIGYVSWNTFCIHNQNGKKKKHQSFLNFCMIGVFGSNQMSLWSLEQNRFNSSQQNCPQRSENSSGTGIFFLCWTKLAIAIFLFFKWSLKYFSTPTFQTQPIRQLNTCMQWYFAIMSLINTASILQSPSEKKIVCLSKLVVIVFPATNIFCHWCIPLPSPQPLSFFRDCLVCTDAFIPVDWSQENWSSCVMSRKEKHGW